MHSSQVPRRPQEARGPNWAAPAGAPCPVKEMEQGPKGAGRAGAGHTPNTVRAWCHLVVSSVSYSS